MTDQNNRLSTIESVSHEGEFPGHIFSSMLEQEAVDFLVHIKPVDAPIPEQRNVNTGRA